MKVKNPVASGKASGRALGGVFSSNRGMETFKKYVKPYQPNTTGQGDIKTRFAYLTKYWKTSLTYTQITLWNNWSLPWTDIYGDAVLLTGINKFVICNDTLLRAGKPITPIPPTATPSEIIAVNDSGADSIWINVDGIPDAEVTAQEDFIRIKVLGKLQDITYTTGILVITATGIPISRLPLKKNWKIIYFYNCRTGFDGTKELNIQVIKQDQAPALEGLEIRRYNKWGYWSGKQIYTFPVTVINLLKNGRFESGADWTLTGGWTISGGEAHFNGDGNCEQDNLPVSINHFYKIRIDVTATPTGARCYVRLGAITFGQFNQTGHYEYTAELTTSGKLFQIDSQSGFAGSVDNITVEEVF